MDKTSDRGIRHPHNGMSLRARFELSFIPEPNSGCWLWTGALVYPFGVARPRIRHKGKARAAHRIAIELYKGPIPQGKLALHTCHNTFCVNPDHLYVGTHTQNTQDMMRAGRHFTQANPEALAALKLRMGLIHRKRAQAQFCKRGHPFSGHNLIVARDGRRACRICRNASRKSESLS